MKNRKRFISWLLVAVLAGSSVHMPVFAGDDVEILDENIPYVLEDTPENSGVAEDFYTPEEYDDVSEEVADFDYSEDATDLFSVVLDANGGFFVDEWDDELNQTVTSDIVYKKIPAGGVVATFPTYGEENSDVSFLGWSLDRDGELITQGYEEFAPSESCALYAIWGTQDVSFEEAESGYEDQGVEYGIEYGEEITDFEDPAVEYPTEEEFPSDQDAAESPEEAGFEDQYVEYPPEEFLTEEDLPEEELFEVQQTEDLTEEGQDVSDLYVESAEEAEDLSEDTAIYAIEDDADEDGFPAELDEDEQFASEDEIAEEGIEEFDEEEEPESDEESEESEEISDEELTGVPDEAAEAETVGETDGKKAEDVLTWEEFRDFVTSDYFSLSKEEKMALYDAYEAYRAEKRMTAEGEFSLEADSGSISNAYLDVSVGSDGRFSIGNVEGNPNYTSDNGRKLLYGYPSTGTSRTLLYIDGDARIFTADVTTFKNNVATSVMYLSDYDISVTQKLSFISSGTLGGSQSVDDCVRIEYKITNTGSSSHQVGIRIMLDTMLASNDDAPFKVKGTGNVTSIRNYYLSSGIPESYQVYDNLDHPTTIATGYLVRSGETVPDRVQFTNWREISNDYWGYEGTPGGTLGDSAVGIYWDPASLASGKSKTVTTYYGVGVGSGIGSNSNGGSKISGKKVGVEVKSNGKNKGVEGAEVSIKDQDGNITTGTTDAEGFVNVDVAFSGTQEAEITVKAAGYKDKVVKRSIKGGDRISVTIKDENDNKPMVETVTLDNKDIMNGTVHFIDDSGNDIKHAKQSSIKTVKLVVTSDTPDCVYYLLQDNQVVDKNSTGIFELKTVDTKSGTVIEKFTSGGIREAYCVAKDGTASRKVRLGIKVSIPSIATKTIADLNLWPYGSTNIATGTLGALLLGDKLEFGLKTGAKLKVEIGENGKVKVSYNLSKMPNEEQAEKIKAASAQFQSASEHRLQASKVFDGLIEKGDRKVSLGIPKHVDFSYGGYAEGILKEGKAEIKLAVFGTATLSASYTVNYFWVVPLYVTVSGSGSVKAELSGTGQLTFDDMRPSLNWSGSINPSVSVALEGGVGCEKIAKLGVEGKGTLSYTFTIPAMHHLATLTGEANLKMKFLLFEKSLNLAKTTIKLMDSEDWNGASDQGPNLFDELDKQEYKLRSRDYMLNESAVGASSDDGYTINSGNIYSETQPVIVYANNKKYKFWIDEDMNRSSANGTKLMYAVCEDGYWSSEEAVDDDGTADFAVDAAYDGNGKIYVVWENSDRIFDDQTVTIDEMASAQEINLKVLDIATGTFGGTVSLTSNATMDAIPAVAADANAAYISWERLNGSIGEGNTQNTIYNTIIRNGQSDSETSISCGTQTVSDLYVSMQSGTPVTTYTLATIENGEIVSQETYLYEFATEGLERLGEDGDIIKNIMTSSLAGQEAMFWHQDGNIYYRLSGSDEIAQVFEQPFGEISEFTIADSPEKAILIWKGNNVEDAYDEEELPESSAVLYAADYSGGKWGNPYLLYNCECDSVHSLHAEITESNELLLSYVAVNYDSEGNISSSNMIEVCPEERSDATLISFDYDPDQAEAEKALPLSLTVGNTGTKRIDTLTVEIEGGYNSYSKVFSDCALEQGETLDLQIEDFIVSDEIGDGTLVDYTLTVCADDDAQWSNGETSFTLGYTDIVARQLNTTVVNGTIYYPVSIVNRSRVDAQNVSVKVLSDSEDGSIIYDTLINSLPAGDYEVLYLSEEDLGGSVKFYTYITSDTPMDNEGLEYTAMYCSSETLRVLSDVNVSVSADEGGTILAGESGSYVSGQELTLTAEPDEGYIFESWTADNGTFENENEESTIFYVPEEDAEVRARFTRIEEVTGLRMSDESLSISIGDTHSLTLTGNPVPNNSLFFWSSDKPEVAAVNSRGTVEGLSEGTAVITAQARFNPAQKAECTVTVVEPTITNIRMVYPKVTLTAVGEKKLLKVDMLTEPENLESLVNLDWKSDNPDVVSVDENGVITAKASGSAVITVKPQNQEGISAQCTVMVSLAITDINLLNQEGNPVSSLTLNTGDPETILTASAIPDDVFLAEEYNWTSSNEEILSIEASGEHKETAKITGNLPGTTVLTVSYGDTEKNVRVTVNAPARNVTLSASTLSVRYQDSAYLEATVDPENTTDELEWTSANTSIASVYDGRIYGNSVGTTTITARAGNARATCRVTVYEVPATKLTLSESAVTITKGESYRLTATVLPSDTTDEVTWTSSNTEIATVYDGYISAVKPGTATITATAGRYSGRCTVTVQQKQYETVIVTGVEGFESDYTDADTHYYASGVDKVWQLNTSSAVRGVWLKFDANTEFENGYDYLEILDRDGEPVPVKVGDQTGVTKLTGTDLQNRTISITSLPIRIHMHTDGSVSRYGFKVASIKYLYNISKATVSLAKSSYTYTGKEITPAVTVKAGNVTLKKDVDYTVSYQDNKVPGTATVTVTGKSPNTGSKTLTFDILHKYNIAECAVSLAKNSYTYTGSEIKPVVTVKSGTAVLKKDVDYTVTYKANKVPGVASVVVTGKASGTGKKTITFKILPKAVSGLKQSGTTKTSLKLSWTKQSGITGYKVYKYANSKYTLVKTISGAAVNSCAIKSLKAGTPYTYAVAAYKKSGSTTLIGSKKTLKVYTVPTINKPTVTAGKKKATLKWKKVKNASGYEVYASDKKGSGYKKAKTISKGGTVTATISNLKSKKRKYFKIRAYIKTASGKVYSAYSSVVFTTIK